MADLTLERIAELRACHDKVRSFHGTHDLGGLAAAMHEWSRQLQMSSDVLLDAAERGLTAMAWTVNGPDVEKPKDAAWCVVRYGSGVYRTGFWSDFAVWRIGSDRTPLVDEYVTHFMAIKEPTDG